MKKCFSSLLSVLCLVCILLTALTASGCSGKRESFPLPEITSEVLYDTVNADPYGVTLCIKFMVPSAGLGLDYCIFNPRAVFCAADGQISQPDKESLKRFNHTSRMPDLTGSDKKEFERKRLGATNHFCLYEDTELYLYYVSDGSESEYAGHTVLCEYCRGEIRYLTVPDTPAADGLYSNWTGRLGDVFYLSTCFYDLTDHTLRAYSSPSELPPFRPGEDPYYWSRMTAGEISLQDLTGSDHLTSLSSQRVGNTVYILFGKNNRFYGETPEDYKGDTAVCVIYDLTAGETRRVERICCANLCIEGGYWAMAGSDGGLYTPYAPVLPEDKS